MKQSCSQCKQNDKPDTMVQFGEVWVCAKCKDTYLQRLKEGLEINPTHSGKFLIKATCPECGACVPSDKNNRTCPGCATKLIAKRPALYPLFVILYAVFIVLPLTAIAVFLLHFISITITKQFGVNEETVQWVDSIGFFVLLFGFPAAIFTGGIRMSDSYITKLEVVDEKMSTREQESSPPPADTVT